MQKTLLALGTLFALASCGDKGKTTGFNLKGTFKNSNGELIYLEKLVNTGPVKVDSTTLNEKGEFEFNNYTPNIGFYRVKVDQQNFAMLVLDSADKVVLSGDLKDLGNTYSAEGSAETKLFMEYSAMARRRELRLDSLNNAFMALAEPFKMDTKKVDSLSKTFEAPFNAIVEPTNKELIDKIVKNANMYASLMAIQTLEPDNYTDVYKTLDQGLSARYPNDRSVRLFHEMVQRLMSTGVGQQVPDISLPSPDGKTITLSSLKGKVVLVDFWASWCAPCRRETPNVVKAYAKYKNKGFEIYGVSLDQEKDRWVEAIQKDNMTWLHVSELKQWESEVVRTFSIKGIPFTLLIDREGKIIAKNLRGEELENKLAEVLN